MSEYFRTQSNIHRTMEVDGLAVQTLWIHFKSVVIHDVLYCRQRKS